LKFTSRIFRFSNRAKLKKVSRIRKFPRIPIIGKIFRRTTKVASRTIQNYLHGTRDDLFSTEVEEFDVDEFKMLDRDIPKTAMFSETDQRFAQFSRPTHLEDDELFDEDELAEQAHLFFNQQMDEDYIRHDFYEDIEKDFVLKTFPIDGVFHKNIEYMREVFGQNMRQLFFIVGVWPIALGWILYYFSAFLLRVPSGTYSGIELSANFFDLNLINFSNVISSLISRPVWDQPYVFLLLLLLYSSVVLILFHWPYKQSIKDNANKFYTYFDQKLNSLSVSFNSLATIVEGAQRALIDKNEDKLDEILEKKAGNKFLILNWTAIRSFYAQTHYRNIIFQLRRNFESYSWFLGITVISKLVLFQLLNKDYTATFFVMCSPIMVLTYCSVAFLGIAGQSSLDVILNEVGTKGFSKNFASLGYGQTLITQVVTDKKEIVLSNRKAIIGG